MTVKISMKNPGNFVISCVSMIFGFAILITEAGIPNELSTMTNGELAILKIMLLSFGALFFLLGAKWFKLHDIIEIEPGEMKYEKDRSEST